MKKPAIFLLWVNLPKGSFLFLLFVFCFQLSCKKHSPEQSEKLDLTMNKQLSSSVVSSERNPVQKPFHAKIVVKTKDTISRNAQLPPQSIAKLRERLNIKSPKKLSNQTTQRKGSNSTLSASSFSVNYTDSYTWSCSATVDGMPGVNYGIDWYIVDMRTGNYSHLTTTNTLSIDFQIYLPDYGYYFIYAYEPIYATEAFTNDLLIGDPNSAVYPGAVYHNGVIELTSSAAFENLVTQLDNAYEQHNADFFDSRDHMTDDQINDYAESVNFDEFKPLRDFESYFGFYSLRNKIELEVSTWLASDNEANNPEENYSIDDEIEQTVLNTDGDVKIGGTVYAVELPDPVNPNRACHTGPINGCVENDKTIINELLENGTRKAWKKIKIAGHGLPVAGNGSTFGIRPKVKGKIVFFKKKTSGWKRHATRLDARIFGNAYNTVDNSNTNCVFRETFLKDWDRLKRRYRRKSNKDWGIFTYTKYCEITAEFKINSSIVSISLQ